MHIIHNGIINAIFRRNKPRQAKSGDHPQLHPETDAQPSCESSSPASSFPDGIKELNDCPNATVDVCFVHGLSGNRDSTWTPRGESAPWPETLLPSRLSKARIITYGYDAYITQSPVASSNRLIDHAINLLADLTTNRAQYQAESRPLIFVAHSLGGLVCKEAILLSRNNPETHLQSVFKSLRGIIFMGTPHRGSWMADWAKIPASALGLVKPTNTSLLKILETDDQLLESIQVRFWAMMRELREGGRRLEVTCFFEELPLPTIGKVVSKESATLEGYNAVSIHANHREMVKFGSTEDNGFRRLVGELLRWESQIRTNSESAALDPTVGNAEEAGQPLEEDEVSKHAFRHYGSGSVNVNYGSGPQNNNIGTGNQFNSPVHTVHLPPPQQPR
ncbi:unnamed protein product [Clonostachys rosea]|uniref:DUF676 domain-containing protein n=1 Tax=Bionectria ochroleuca TaxID=29856 RepID=A0ABY6V0H3_BIOOC|nr:unnamed protein product [Clonostachys rosea]